MKQANPPTFTFVVFSLLDDTTLDVIPKYVQCPNCGIIHRVVDICKSVIINGKEALSSIRTVDDTRGLINQKLQGVLDAAGCDISTWEAVENVIEHGRWGESVTIAAEMIDGQRTLKSVKIISETLFKVETTAINDVILGYE